MNTPSNHTGKPGHHPMMIAAAIAIILFCLAGTAAIMGWIPTSIGSNTTSGELTASDRAALASRLTDNNATNSNVGNSLASGGTPGVEAQRERDRVAQLDRDAASARESNPMVARAPVAPAYREPDAYRDSAAYREPVRLAQADPAPARNTCSNCGRVESVRTVKTRAQGSGLGAAGGAVLGGLLGNQIGGGNGKKLATVAGAVGGAVVGNQVEGNMKAHTSYVVTVRMDNGGSRTFNLQNLNGYNTGDRIKIVNGALRHAG